MIGVVGRMTKPNSSGGRKIVALQEQKQLAGSGRIMIISDYYSILLLLTVNISSLSIVAEIVSKSLAVKSRDDDGGKTNMSKSLNHFFCLKFTVLQLRRCL